MKKKIIGILVMTLLVITAVLPVVGSKNEIETVELFNHFIEISLRENPEKHTNMDESLDSNAPPLPGCIIPGALDLGLNYQIETNGALNKIKSPSYDEDVISLIQQINEALILGYLENLTSFGPRVTATSACKDAGTYIGDEFENMGLQYKARSWSYEDFYGITHEATLPGVNESSDEIYIICAHYDSVPGSPGADDDGSGVAAVLSAAKVMSQYTFSHTVRFVAFDGEEQGLLGSYYYAARCASSDDNIVAVLNADMIGYAETYGDTRKIRVYEDENSEWVTDFTTDVGEQYYDYIGVEVIPSGYTRASDHYRFWQHGFNAIFYAEYNFNNYYHSPADTIEHMYIPYAVKCSKLIIATLAELSQMNNIPSKPTIPSGPSSGKPKEEYTFSTSTTDPDGDQLYYMWDWGDGNFSNWLGPFETGDTCEASYTWEQEAKFNITVKAKDIYDAESDWSDPLSFSTPKNKSINTPFLDFLENFLQQYLILYQLLLRFLRL